MTATSWMHWTLRIVAWGVWQAIWLLFTFVVYVSLFSEYGAYGNRSINPVAAVVFLVFAVWIGTWLPIRDWRERRAHAASEAGAFIGKLTL